jgi:GTP-binding nuclear protein Ran
MALFNEPIQRFKIIITGDAGVGKTTFVKQHLRNKFTTEYVPTLGVDVDPITFNTNYGSIIFNVWDTAGQEKYGFLCEGYYVGVDGAICMFDTTSNTSYRNLKGWITKIQNENKNSNIPTIICGNKCDIDGGHMSISQIYTDVIKISAKTKTNIDLPFLTLARKLTGHDDLVFIEKS